jgi:hypothetical protein
VIQQWVKTYGASRVFVDTYPSQVLRFEADAVRNNSDETSMVDDRVAAEADRQRREEDEDFERLICLVAEK